MYDELLIIDQYEDYKNLLNFAFLSSDIQNMFIERKDKKLVPTDLIGEFKPRRLFDEAFKIEYNPSEADKKWIDWCEKNGISYTFEEGKLTMDL